MIKLAATIFSFIAILHGLRLFYGWEAAIGGWTVPFWVSWLAMALAAILVVGLWRESK